MCSARPSCHLFDRSISAKGSMSGRGDSPKIVQAIRKLFGRRSMTSSSTTVPPGRTTRTTRLATARRRRGLRRVLYSRRQPGAFFDDLPDDHAESRGRSTWCWTTSRRRALKSSSRALSTSGATKEGRARTTRGSDPVKKAKPP